jgi:iron-sulfur cluster assembly protein
MVASRFVGWAFLLLAAAASVGCDNDSRPDPVGPSSRPPVPQSSKAPEPEAARPFGTVTPKAAAEIRRITAAQEFTGTVYLRVRVVRGGCCGYLHKLDLDPVASAEDHVAESGGVKVVAHKRQVEMLRGSEVDFGRAGHQVGFKIRNPNFDGEGARKWLAVLDKDKPAE